MDWDLAALGLQENECRGRAVCRSRDRSCPPLIAAVRPRERILLILLGFGFFFEPEGRGLWASSAGLSSPASLARESLPACHLKLGNLVPEACRSRLCRCGFDRASFAHASNHSRRAIGIKGLGDSSKSPFSDWAVLGRLGTLKSANERSVSSSRGAWASDLR